MSTLEVSQNLLDNCRSEGFYFRTWSKPWACRKGVIYIPDVPPSKLVDLGITNWDLCFCHEWGHCRLYANKTSPIQYYSEFFGYKGDLRDVPMPERRGMAWVIVEEELLAWKEVPTMMKFNSTDRDIALECFNHYLKSFKMSDLEKKYWLNRFP